MRTTTAGFCISVILAMNPVAGHAGQKTLPKSLTPSGQTHLMNGTHFKEGAITMDKKGPKNGTASEGVKESTSLNFGKIKQEYRQQDPQ